MNLKEFKQVKSKKEEIRKIMKTKIKQEKRYYINSISSNHCSTFNLSRE